MSGNWTQIPVQREMPRYFNWTDASDIQLHCLPTLYIFLVVRKYLTH